MFALKRERAQLGATAGEGVDGGVFEVEAAAGATGIEAAPFDEDGPGHGLFELEDEFAFFLGEVVKVGAGNGDNLR